MDCAVEPPAFNAPSTRPLRPTWDSAAGTPSSSWTAAAPRQKRGHAAAAAEHGSHVAAPPAAMQPTTASMPRALADSCMDLHGRVNAKAEALHDNEMAVASAAVAEAHAPVLRRRRSFLGTLGRLLGRAIRAAGSVISPKGPGENDISAFERCLNVLTCVPFFLVGQAFLRHPPGLRFGAFGQAMRMVGAVASLYHASSGPSRLILRKADYYSICTASVLLRAAAVGSLPSACAWVTPVLVPIKPTLVTAANLVAVEVKCMAIALSSRSASLLRAWLQHALLSLAAITSFGLEGALSETVLGPLAHSSWHLLAAGGMLTTSGLLHEAHRCHA